MVTRSSTPTEAWTFISYKRADADAVRALATNLEVRFGADHIFFDLSDIHGGDRWEALIQSEVLSSHVVIAAITKSWLPELQRRQEESASQDYVVYELETAMSNSVPIIPVIFPDVDMPDPDELPPAIKDLTAYQAVRLTHLNWDRDMDALVERVCAVASEFGGGGRKDRERKARVAHSLANWLPTQEHKERVLLKTCGTKEDDAVLLLTASHTWIDRNPMAETPGWRVPHDRLASFCRHKGCVWLMEPDSEHLVERLPERDVDTMERILREHAPDARFYQKAPDQQVRDGLIVFSREGIAERRGIDLSWVNDIKFSEEEELVLASVKLAIMEKDLAADPDLPDRIAKRKAIDSYVTALVTQFQAGEKTDELPGRISDIQGWIGKDDWPGRFRRCLGALDPQDARPIFTDGGVLARMLDRVTRRDRALLLLIELAAFYPWGDKVKFEKGVREEALERIVTRIAADVDVGYFHEVEDALAKRKKSLAGSERNWGKIAAFAGGAAVLGVLTMGMAAPVIGTAIGGAMGLSGAAATSAGLAFLGGGSLAAGGLGMAGGTALVTILGGAVGTVAGLKASGITKEALLVESAKLGVTSEYVFLREHGAISHVTSIMDVLEAERQEWQADIDKAKQEKAKQDLPDDKSMVDKAKGALRRSATDIDELIERSKIVERLRDELDEQLTRFITQVNTWVGETDPIVEEVKASGVPTAVVAVEVVEGVVEGAERLSHLVPALIARQDGTPVLNVLFKVASGKDKTSGAEAVRKLGITHPLAAGFAGGTIDVLAHPLLWASAATVLAAAGGASAVGAHLVQAAKSGELATVALLPMARLDDVLSRAGFESIQLGRALSELVEREMKNTLGGAAIQVAEGLQLTIRGTSAPETGDYRL